MLLHDFSRWNVTNIPSSNVNIIIDELLPSFSLSIHWWTPSSLYTIWWFIPIKQLTSIIFSTHNIWNHFRCFSESPWINLATSEHYAVIWQLASLLMYVKFVCHEALLWNWNPQFYEHLIFWAISHLPRLLILLHMWPISQDEVTPYS